MASEITDLDHEMRQLLARMSLLSYGRTAAWDAKSNGGKPGARILYKAQLGQVLHEHWADEYKARLTDAGRRETIEAARKDLEDTLRQRERKAGETDAQKRARCIRDCEGLDVSDAAQMMRETKRWVIGVREEKGRDPSRGIVPRGSQDWRVTARELDRSGVSLREIGRRVGKSHEAVRQAIRRAA